MRRYLIAGLIVWVPLGITIWVLHWLLTSLDQILLVLPENARPRALLGFDIPGLGLVFFFIILLLTGVLAANFFGQRLILPGQWAGLPRADARRAADPLGRQCAALDVEARPLAVYDELIGAGR